MKYYSDVTRCLYESENDLLIAEQEVKEAQERKEAEKAKRANEREVKLQELKLARENYNDASRIFFQKMREFDREYSIFPILS